MKKIVSIEGMSCEHCAAAVKSALEELEAVKSVKVELKKNSATLKLTEDLADSEIEKAIADAGFKVVAITKKQSL